MAIERLLIFRVGHLGDTLIALPALWAIRRHLPEAHISLLTNIDLKNPNYISPVDVLPQSGLIDDFIAYPTNNGVFGSVKSLVGLALQLRRERFDLAVYLMPRVRSTQQLSRDQVFFRLAGVGSVGGMAFLANNRLERPNACSPVAVEPESDFLLRMVNEIGIRDNAIETDLLLTGDEVSAADEWLATSVGDHVKDRLIAVAPGGKLEFKCWGEDKYLQVVSNLIKQKGCYPIFFGGLDDRAKGDRLINACGEGANAAGKLSVRQSAVVLGKCSLYLGNDTGTMHLAAIVGVPCVAIFSSMDFIGRWSPIGTGHRILRTGSRCEGCMHLEGDRRHTCMDSVHTGEVLDACLEILNRS